MAGFKLPSHVPGIKPKFSREEMTLGELDIANGMGLSEDSYCEFKSLIWSELLESASAEATKNAREEAKRSLRSEITAELTPMIQDKLLKSPDLLEQARKGLEQSLQQQALKASKAVYESEMPTKSDIEAFSDAIRDIEIDCMMLAAAASKDSVKKRKETRNKESLYNFLYRSFGLAMGPLAFYTIRTFGMHDSAFFVIPAIVFTILCFAWSFRDDEYKSANNLQAIAGSYLALASDCRLARKMTVKTKTRAEIISELQVIRNAKDHQNKVYRPEVQVLDEVRPDVRHRLAEEIDPEVLISEEFDDRLSAR